MPIFCISVTNQDFEAENEQELPTLEVAQDEAIKSALQIGIDEVGITRPFFAAEVKIDCDGEYVSRYIVTVGVSLLR